MPYFEISMLNSTRRTRRIVERDAYDIIHSSYRATASPSTPDLPQYILIPSPINLNLHTHEFEVIRDNALDHARPRFRTRRVVAHGRKLGHGAIREALVGASRLGL